ncbi:MAG: Fe-S cluster assembly protein SufD [Rhodocyclaceae bacterium]|nr:Fe-S cluster assembly protein SufD [Rhodocyclaceae bacterium]
MNALVADRFVADFERVKALLPGAYVPWLQLAREEAFTAFLDKGFPTLRDEDWKYTSVAPIEKSRFVLTPAAAKSCNDLGGVGTQALPGARLLVFIDGRHAPELSRLGALPAGVTVDSLAAMLEREPERLQAALACPAAGYASGFAALNAAFVSDGAYVHLAAGAELEEPLQLLFLATAANLATHSRNVVVAGAGSRVRIVEQHASLNAGAYFSNVVTDIEAGRGAAVEHHKLQQEGPQAFHIAAVNAALGGDASFASSSFAFGGALARTAINVGLNGAKAQCSLDGLTMTDGRQHVDHHTRIDHAQPQCSSREFYKGVLDGASRTVFNGKVIVRAGAQQSDALQTNRNLLLSDQAEADTKPQLEIWADDVKCGHGATVGQLDPDQIFYLRARGVDAAAARALLVFAFANEVVERIRWLPLRARLERLLRARLPHGAGALQ